MKLNSLNAVTYLRPNLNVLNSPDKKALNSYSNATNVCSINAANAIRTAATLNFKANLRRVIDDNTQEMITCNNKDEVVGKATYVNGIVFDKQKDLIFPNDTEKTNGYINGKIIRNSISKNMDRSLSYKHTVRQTSDPYKKSKDFDQMLEINLTPINVLGEGTKEQVYIVNTKGNKGDNFVAVVEDGDDVILTNAGSIKKKNPSDGVLRLKVEQKNNIYNKFEFKAQEVEPRVKLPSVGEGGTMVIGLEDQRFVDEIINSVKEFKEKIDNEEIVLNQFVASPSAQDMEYVMLAGGFGSRAEYTNASSDAILHGKENGAQSTKGSFRTATGLTPMETTFITLHNAGLVDFNNIEFGKNVKFYINKTGINAGNGGYSINLINKIGSGKKGQMFLSNDAMSRMTKATEKACSIISSGDAAIVMIAKEIPAKDCINKFGIMRVGDDNEILEFAEKPASIPDDFEIDGNCLTNTFHFAVSNEALKALDMMEPFFSKTDSAKEKRDWSKQFVPIIQTLTQEDDIEIIKDKLAPVFKVTKEELEDNRNDFEKTVEEAKEVLNGQKIYAVPTSEPWADCGSLNQLYYTTMQIVNNDFSLEDFEIAHAQACVDTNTGLVASTPEQLEKIRAKYDVENQIMAVPKAKKVSQEDISDIPVIIDK